ncbi:PhzF family phenazine biosynthesis protein [Streptomyces sp. NPDC054796]
MRVWQVDAFSDERYQGNPAGVIQVPDGFPATAHMQDIAARLALPTTAFVIPLDGGEFRIRWFTPRKELNVCGHATIATAWQLHEESRIRDGEWTTFHTGDGPLYTRREHGRMAIDLPRVEVADWPAPPGLEDALGTGIVRCTRASDDVLIEVKSQEAVALLEPDFARLAQIDCRGHIVTARGDEPGTDFVSRTFFPALGVDEDQVCVSAHCKLGPYWQAELHKDEMSTSQLSARGGRLFVKVTEDRVQVSGTAKVQRVFDVD